LRILFQSIFAIFVLQAGVPFIDHAAAGSIGYKTIRSYMDWEPDCYKPSPPSYYISDVDSYNMAVDEFNSYVSEVRSYISCLQNEAEQDLKTLSNALSNGLGEKRSEVVGDLESAKSDLLLQKSLLD